MLKRKAADAVEKVFESTSIALGRGGRVELPGFAIFDVPPQDRRSQPAQRYQLHEMSGYSDHTFSQIAGGQRARKIPPAC